MDDGKGKPLGEKEHKQRNQNAGAVNTPRTFFILNFMSKNPCCHRAKSWWVSRRRSSQDEAAVSGIPRVKKPMKLLRYTESLKASFRISIRVPSACSARASCGNDIPTFLPIHSTIGIVAISVPPAGVRSTPLPVHKEPCWAFGESRP